MVGTKLVNQDYSSDARMVQPDEINQFKKLITPRVTSVSSAYTVLEDDGIILGNGTFSVTLPLASESEDKRLWIKNIGTGVVSVETAVTTEAIDSELTETLIEAETLTLVSDASNWWII